VDRSGTALSPVRVTQAVIQGVRAQELGTVFRTDGLAAKFATPANPLVPGNAPNLTTPEAVVGDASSLPPVVRFSIVTAGVNPLNSGSSLNDGNMSVQQVESILSGQAAPEPADNPTPPPGPAGQLPRNEDPLRAPDDRSASTGWGRVGRLLVTGVLALYYGCAFTRTNKRPRRDR
jgi:hypothetical protein